NEVARPSSSRRREPRPWRQVDPEQGLQSFELLRVHLLDQIGEEVVLTGLAEDHAIDSERTAEGVKLRRVSREGERRNVSLDRGATWDSVDPIRNDAIVRVARLALSQLEETFPRIRPRTVRKLPDTVGESHVLANGVTFVTVDATLALFEV